MRAMPSTAVKAHNRSAMAQYLYGHSHVTKQELERELGLSLPTITQNLHALEDDGLIRKGELQDSTGGRKAQNYEFNPDHRTAIGVVMRSNELRLCAINLYGNVIEKRNDALPYRNTNVYYQRIGGIINNFAADVEKKHGKVLGVSFAIQGILSPRRHHHHLRHHYGQHWAHARNHQPIGPLPVHDDPRFRCLSHGRTLVRLHAHRCGVRLSGATPGRRGDRGGANCIKARTSATAPSNT
ncbi:NagC family transcriptional regulator [Bifidobacterium longum subsp. longum]|nr:NagC family transcriptional regulator [Bifidobacterium longum subsp. longum]